MMDPLMDSQQERDRDKATAAPKLRAIWDQVVWTRRNHLWPRLGGCGWPQWPKTCSLPYQPPCNNPTEGLSSPAWHSQPVLCGGSLGCCCKAS